MESEPHRSELKPSSEADNGVCYRTLVLAHVDTYEGIHGDGSIAVSFHSEAGLLIFVNAQFP